MTIVSKQVLGRLIERIVEQQQSLLSSGLLNEEVRMPFKMSLPPDMVRLAKIIHNDGHELYVVGGAVRDAILGKVPKDYDVATDAQPEKILQILSKHPEYRTLEIGKSFGIINVITPDGNEYEVATFREESYVGGDSKEDFIKFLKGKGPGYEERLRLFLDMSKNL